MRKIIRNGILVLVIGALGAIVFTKVSFSQSLARQYQRPEISLEQEMKKADPQLGKRIFEVRSGCIDCHGADLSGAKFIDDPALGVYHGANITPYGLNDWTDQDIATAIRYGIHKSGRSLRFMPSYDYAGLSKSDLASLIAYLRSVPSVEKKSEEPKFGPLAMFLAVIGEMPVAFPAQVVDPKIGFQEKPEEKATFEFGKYLASACVGCHGNEYRGGKIPGGDPAWPPAANIRLGSNPAWSLESFRSFLSTGVSPTTGQPARAPMPVAQLKQLEPTEVEALWLFLSTLK